MANVLLGGSESHHSKLVGRDEHCGR